MAFDYAAKIRALLAQADGEQELGNDGAAAGFRTKAAEWMKRYQIEEEAALAVDPTLVEPTSLVIDFKPRDFTLAAFYSGLIRILAQHCEVRYNVERINYTGYKVTVVGYEGDLKYFEFLWTSAFLMFTTKIDPTWDADRPEGENIFLLRQAGFKRADIANMAGWDGTKAADRAKVQRIYLAEAARRGVVAAATGLGFQAKDYRQAYARGFNGTLASRLMMARDAADSAGGVMVLSGRAERVDEAFYMLFPEHRPTVSVEVEYVDPRKDCGKCIKAKSGACNDHSYLRPRKWTQADEQRWQTQQHGPSAQAGRATGQAAAEDVLLRGTASPKARRVEASNVALEG